MAGPKHYYSSRCSCRKCTNTRARIAREEAAENNGGTMGATSFRDKPQRDDPTVTNTYFNTPGDREAHGHVKYRNNPDGTTDYQYARDVEGNEYDV